MSCFIKKIFQGKIDETVHAQFIRFSKGVFENKAVFNLSRNDKIKVSTTYELANDMVLLAAELSKKLKAAGILMTKERVEELKGVEKKGLFNYEIDQEMDSARLKEIVKKAYYSLLDCSGEGIELKIKRKLPRPSPKGIGKVNDKFCVMQADIKFWPQIKEWFVWDAPEGKKYRVINKYEIKEIVMPPNEKDFEKIRILAKRKGKITSVITVDGKEMIKEKDFAA